MNIFQAPAMPAPSEKSMGNLEMRDYFAAKAMQGLMGRAWGDMPGDQLFAIWANSAYAMADAMLAERKKKKP